MEELKNLEEERWAAGGMSGHPPAIVGPAILATAVSTLAGVIFCKVMDGKRRA